MTAEWIQEFKHPISYLLLEDSSYILQEDSSLIILEQTGSDTGLWVNQTKN